MTEMETRNPVKTAKGNWQMEEKLAKEYGLFSLVWNLL